MNLEELIATLVVAAVFAVLLAFNIRATRRRHKEAPVPQTELPLAGPAPESTRTGDLPPEFILGPAPVLLEAPGTAPLKPADYIRHELGLPLFDWRAINAWAAQAASPAHARQAAHRAWLLHFRDVLGAPFHVLETGHVFLLSTLESNVALAAADYIATTRKRIAGVLDGVARFAPGEKSILMVFDDEADYYEYVSLYYPEKGEFALSGGMYINAGCPHFVVRRADLSLIEPVIAHELTHSALHHLRLPRWLDEGLAVNTEERLTRPMPSVYTPQEMRIKHLGYWGEEEIQQFWSGASFFRSDDGNLLSYDLARILVQQMGRDWPAFANFIRQAERADAGDAAARAALGLDLPAWVCMLLERDPDPAWAPHAGAWPDDILDEDLGEGSDEDIQEKTPLRTASLKTACDTQ